MKRKKRRVQRALQVAGLPEEVVLGTARLVLLGDSRVTLENHQGIVEYGLERIRVRTQAGLYDIQGQDLRLTYLGRQDLAVEGHISRIDLPGERGVKERE